jgi:glycosyltransferase involved in cell wall biosynthesis
LIYDAHTLLSAELPAYGRPWTRPLAQALGRRLDRLLPRFADHMIVVTEDIRLQLSDEFGFDPERITVVGNGVEIETFLAIRDNVPPRPDLLVYSGTLAPYQGIDLMLAAFARALAARPSLRLRLVVSDSFEPFQATADRLGVANALEVVVDSFPALPHRLAEASIALVPRVDCPGIPQKLLNYMAAARGIVSFAGSAKLLEHEVTGLIVPNRDVDSFARAIVRLADDPELALRLGTAARRQVLDTATWDRAARHCEAVYRAVLGQNQAARASATSGLRELRHGMRSPDQLTPVP